MNFIIKYARSTKNMNLLLTLEKSGNKYIVNLEDISCWKSIHRDEVNTMSVAETLYDALADNYGMNLRKECDTSEAYAFINSQHD